MLAKGLHALPALALRISTALTPLVSHARGRHVRSSTKLAGGYRQVSPGPAPTARHPSVHDHSRSTGRQRRETMEARHPQDSSSAPHDRLLGARHGTAPEQRRRASRWMRSLLLVVVV